MIRLSRLLRHLGTTPWAARRAFPPEDLRKIGQAIAASEAKHGGEIRFAVESALPWSYLWRDAPLRQRAVMVFAKLRVWDTEQNNGVLIYLDLADRGVEIVADRGIARRVEPQRWRAICDSMRAGLARGEHAAAVIAAIEQVGALLALHFPLVPGAEHNEVSNRPVVL